MIEADEPEHLRKSCLDLGGRRLRDRIHRQVLSVRICHTPDRHELVFDDDNAVANGGHASR